MSERRQRKRPSPSVVEIASGDEADSSVVTASPPRLRHQSIIEVNSDLSEEEEVEIIGVNESPRRESTGGADDIQITGEARPQIDVHILPSFVEPSHFESRGARPRRAQLPPMRPTSRSRHLPSPEILSRNVRRRTNFSQSPRFNHPSALPPFYQASFLDGLYPSPLVSHGDIPAMLRQHHHHIIEFFHGRENDVSSAIMERISRDEENSLDRKMELENKHNKKSLDQKKNVAGGELKGYTNNISPEVNMVCELCGITLGEGIPKDFMPNPEFDEEFEKHVQDSHVPAPWYCIRQCFDTDVEFSKRVFSAKCGHVFCGRCMKNIGNRPPAREAAKSKQLSILNPQISAPRKCPAKECGKAFTKSSFFTELYL